MDDDHHDDAVHDGRPRLLRLLEANGRAAWQFVGIAVALAVLGVVFARLQLVLLAIFVALVPLGTLSLSLSSSPPPPPPGEISSLSARPSSSLPCIARFADLAAPGESNSTKPKPRDRFAPPGSANGPPLPKS